MATIRKKIRGKQVYFYLEHTIRKGDKIEKKELYLGKKIPKDIEEIKKNFLYEIYREKWEKILEKIKEGYQKELKKMPPSAKQKEIETFAIQFTFDTQKIEGSTLTLRETADLLERKITPKGRPIHDVKEAEAHWKIFLEMLKCKKDLSLSLVLKWHKELFNETKPDIAGKIRNYQVKISGSKFVPPYPVEVYPMLRDFFRWYEKNKKKLHPVELAGLVHLKFVTIHPFADGNGRISRLMMNFVLNKNGFPLLNISYKNRNSYYTALERSQIKKQDYIFLNWFIKRYIKENKKYLSYGP
ncbi:Fic family protein [Candidatus Parcubacteria bacterium]|nr:Fic family protein [Candidatus Parcubacteria bacterium]